MILTLSGIKTSVNRLLLNAITPMVVTVGGMETLVSCLPENAVFPMPVPVAVPIVVNGIPASLAGIST
jgi:hypothetical protein